MTLHSLTLLAQLASPDLCAGWGDLAHVIMTARQERVPIVKVLTPLETSEIATGLVLIAYQQDVVSDGRFAALSFRLAVERACREVTPQ